MSRIKPINQNLKGETRKKLIDKMIDFLLTEGSIKSPGGFRWLAIDDSLWAEICHDQKAWRQKREIKRLQEQRVVTQKRMAKKILYSLTREGKVLVLRELMKTIKRKLPEGMFVYVMFDIPENVKEIRGMIRSIIKENSFELSQLSVWKCDRDVGYIFQEIVNISGLNDWVHVVEGTDLNYFKKKNRQKSNNR